MEELLVIYGMIWVGLFLVIGINYLLYKLDGNREATKWLARGLLLSFIWPLGIFLLLIAGIYTLFNDARD